jgi:hypothetical protein
MLLRHGRAGDRSRERQVQQQQIRYWPPSVLGCRGERKGPSLGDDLQLNLEWSHTRVATQQVAVGRAWGDCDVRGHALGAGAGHVPYVRCQSRY